MLSSMMFKSERFVAPQFQFYRRSTASICRGLSAGQIIQSIKTKNAAVPARILQKRTELGLCCCTLSIAVCGPNKRYSRPNHLLRAA